MPTRRSPSHTVPWHGSSDQRFRMLGVLTGRSLSESEGLACRCCSGPCGTRLRAYPEEGAHWQHPILYNIVVQLHEELHMSEQVSYSYARQNLARILQLAEERQEPVIITRRGHEDMALIPAGELRSLEESAHLLRSPKNARRLLHALQSALENEGAPHSPASLRGEFGLE